MLTCAFSSNEVLTENYQISLQELHRQWAWEVIPQPIAERFYLQISTALPSNIQLIKTYTIVYVYRRYEVPVSKLASALIMFNGQVLHLITGPH